MKKNVYIIGAGDFGRELESWFDLQYLNENNYKISGYLDDNLNALDGFPSDYKIISTIKDFRFGKDDLALMAISDPGLKEKIFEFLKPKVKFITFISKSVIIGKFVSIGDGTVIAPNCILTTNIKIGKCVTINCGTQIGHENVIGDFCSLMPNINLGGNVNIGNNVFIGSSATIIPGMKITDNVKIGAGSTVINSIRKQQTVFGNPATKI